MARDVIEDAFRPISRDGISLIEVQIKLQKSLVSLAQIAPESFALAAERMSHEALERISTSTLLASEIAEIKSIAQLIPKTISKKTNDPSREI